MKKVYLSQINDGEAIPMDLHNDRGAVLIKKGTVMTTALREKLLKNNISYLITEIPIFNTDLTKLIEADDELIKKVEEIQKVYNHSFHELSQQMERIRKNHTCDKRTLNDIADNLIECMSNNMQIYMGVQGIRKKDYYTYIHSIDVAFYSIIMGKTFGLHRKQLQNLALSALLHDVGKIKVDDYILTKPATLTDEEMEKMKLHTIYGYEIIKNELGYFEEVSVVARQHHERIDGKGYPDGIGKKDIHPFTKIISICDIYDAVTADRVYRKGMLPHKAIEYLMSIIDRHVDYTLTRSFLLNIAAYPLGTKVRLNNGEEGVVVGLHEGFPLRPIVKINNKNSKRDLLKELTILIKEVIDDM